MGYLEVPGASLHYEAIGNGPLLLCISGANGSADAWMPLANALKDKYTVVAYDRRGFSQSHLSATEAQDYEHRLETDADDAALLIKHLSQEPATVIGSSSGAIVSLTLLVRHPDVIRTLLPHEPPAMSVLPDFDDLRATQQEIYDTYRSSGMPPAFLKFADMVKLPKHEAAGLMAAFDGRTGPEKFGNAQYWFEREVLVYPFHNFDVAELEKYKTKLLLANSDLSDQTALQYRANVAFGEKLGLDVYSFPGAHLGYLTHAQQFAEKLLEVLKSSD